MRREVAGGHGGLGEVVVAAGLVVEGEGGEAVLSREPGDLVVELAEVGFGRVGEEGAGLVLQFFGDGEAGAGEGLVQGVVLPVYVEVAERDDVVVVSVHVFRPTGEPRGDGRKFGHAVLRLGAVFDVQGDEDEGLASREEADGVGGAGELLGEGAGGDGGELFLGDDDLAREAGEGHLAGVEEEGEALAVARVARRHVGEDEVPVVAERLEHVAQGLEVGAHLLQGDNVEVRDDLGDGEQGVEVALGAVALLGGPLFGQAAEVAKVPRRDENVALDLLRGDGLVERGAERKDVFCNLRRRCIRNRWHESLLTAQPYPPRPPRVKRTARKESGDVEC